MIYFDNAATGGRKPDCVQRAVRACVEGVCANPGRGGHAAALAQAENVLRARGLLSRFFGGAGAERVVFTKNCTEALNMALFGAVRAYAHLYTRARPHIVTTAMEHNSVLRPLFALQRAGEISLTVVPLTEGTVRPEAIAAAVNGQTLLAVHTLASNVTGAAVDPAAVRALLPERVLLVCDGAQACGHVPVDMQKAGIDALCVAGHKGMQGIQGAGALLLSARFDPAPFAYGGTGSVSFDENMPAFYPDRLEAGTLSCPAVASLAEGALYLLPRMERIAAHLTRGTAYLAEALRSIDGVRVYGAPNPYGILSFASANMQSELFAQALSDEYGIAVRGGLHCAPRMHAALGTAEEGLVRVSLAENNTRAEADTFLAAVRALAARKG